MRVLETLPQSKESHSDFFESVKLWVIWLKPALYKNIGPFVVEQNSRIGQFLYWRILWSISNAIIDQSPWMKHALLPREAQSFYQIPGKAISQSKLSLFDKYHWLFRANAKSKFWKIHLKIWMKLALLPREHQGLYQIPGKAIPQSKLTLFDKYHWLLRANTMSTFKNTPANMNETCPTANKKTSKSLSNTRPSHANGLHQTQHFLTNTLA